MNAALGLSQLSRIEGLIEMRRSVAAAYESLIRRKLPGFVKPFAEPPGTRAVYQMYTIRFLGAPECRERVRARLARAGVTTKVYFEPVHLTAF